MITRPLRRPFLMLSVMPLLWTTPTRAEPHLGEDAKENAAPAEMSPENLKTIDADEASNVLGKKVVNAGNEDMGRVVDVLVNQDGLPVAAVIDFGGFLGVGSRKIAVDWQQLQFRPANHDAPILLGLARTQVQRAPEYKDAAQPTKMVSPPPLPVAAPDDDGQ
jgi:hypothetical protein